MEVNSNSFFHLHAATKFSFWVLISNIQLIIFIINIEMLDYQVTPNQQDYSKDF